MFLTVLRGGGGGGCMTSMTTDATAGDATSFSLRRNAETFCPCSSHGVHNEIKKNRYKI